MIESQVKAFICRRLGDGVIDVELTDLMLQDAINEGKRLYASFLGQRKSAVLAINQNTEYDASLIGSDVDTVVDVFFPLDGESFNNLWSWAGVDFDPSTMAYAQSGSYSALVQYMQYREQGRRIVSADRDWEWDSVRRKLIITPRPDSSQIMVQYLVTYAGIDLTRVHGWEEMIIQDYCLGSAMMTLGNIRTKYADKPSATGAFSMDGDILYANGEQMRAEAIEKLRAFVPPTGFWAE